VSTVCGTVLLQNLLTVPDTPFRWIMLVGIAYFDYTLDFTPYHGMTLLNYHSMSIAIKSVLTQHHWQFGNGKYQKPQWNLSVERVVLLGDELLAYP
jgi:hypothetical protein